MPIQEELRRLLTEAMKAKDLRTADVCRMLNTKVMERRTAKGFKGEVDDALLVDVIGAYRKSLAKAKEEFVHLGEQGAEQAAQLSWEMDFCDRFLPQKMSEDQLRDIVRAQLQATGVTDPKQLGRVVGEIMKAHKGQVDAGDVKRIAEAELLRG
ncbi:MAG: GatB/YqeY domain-containing protein [Myxococcota bacterium]|jgi:uncharacterized protein YqeY|nr:GatB/YqeY domain-containing protein [Myxococcota bacterium]